MPHQYPPYYSQWSTKISCDSCLISNSLLSIELLCFALLSSLLSNNLNDYSQHTPLILLFFLKLTLNTNIYSIYFAFVNLKGTWSFVIFKQIIYFFIIYLQETAIDEIILRQLLKQTVNASWDNSCIILVIIEILEISGLMIKGNLERIFPITPKHSMRLS